MPSLREIARQAGVSTATVSLALRSHPRISADTTMRIQRIAQALNYVPDPRITRWASQRWQGHSDPQGKVIAFISDAETHHPTNNETQFYLQGAQQRAESLGYQLERFSTKRYREPSHLDHVLKARGIEAILVGPFFEENWLRQFPWQDYFVTGVAGGWYEAPVHIVRPNVFKSLQRAWEAAYALGHRRIGLIMVKEPGPAPDTIQRLAAYYERQISRHAPRLPALELPPLIQPNGVSSWLDRYRPTVVIGQTNIVHWWLSSCGEGFPESLSYVGLSCVEGETMNDTIPTGIIYAPEAVGTSAIEALDLRLRLLLKGSPTLAVGTLLEPPWQEGGTLRRYLY